VLLLHCCAAVLTFNNTTILEGFGPLMFGFLMSRFEGFILPGAPYILAAGVSTAALVCVYIMLYYYY
jgi:hypothetical protein